MEPPKDESDDASIILQKGAPLARYGGPPELNPALQYLHSLRSKASERTMRGALDRAARIFDAVDRGVPEVQSDADAISYPWGTPGALTYAKAQAAVALVAKERGPTGAPKKSAARLLASGLKQLARHAFNLEQLDVRERIAIGDVRAPKLSGKTRGRRLTQHEVAKLYEACAADATPAGRRDAALLAVALGGALRRFEISALDVADYARPSRLGRDPVELKVTGKGDKHAEVVAPPDVAVAIEAWLEARGRGVGAMFASSPGRGRGLEEGSRLSASGVYDIIVRRGAEARVSPEIGPHDLRRTSITVFLERTGDLALAKKFARHSDPKTTALYDLREHEALRKALAHARTGFEG